MVGSPLFGVGTWRAGVAPRTGTLLLIIGGPAVLLISQIAALGGALIVLYLAWVILGHSLWSATTKPAHAVPEQTPRAEHIDDVSDIRPREPRK